MNRISKEIGDSDERWEERQKLKQPRKKHIHLKKRSKSLSDKLIPIDNELKNEIIRLPNLPHESVARGHGADDNIKVREGGIMPADF